MEVPDQQQSFTVKDHDDVNWRTEDIEEKLYDMVDNSVVEVDIEIRELDIPTKGDVINYDGEDVKIEIIEKDSDGNFVFEAYNPEKEEYVSLTEDDV